MKTAKTIQLLDANNTNISPAVCIESLYFEQTSGANTYRISLKNRTIIASNDVIKYNPTNDSAGNDIDKMQVPYVYVRKFSEGNGDDKFSVCELNTSTYNIGVPLKRCVSTWLNTNFFNKAQSGNKFIRMDENDSEFSNVNRTNGFYCGTTDASLHIYDASGAGRISWKGKESYVGIDRNTDGTDELKIATSDSNFISLKTSSSKMSLSSDDIDIFAVNHFKLDTGDASILFVDVDIEARGYVNISSALNKDINVSSGNNITLQSIGNIVLNPVYDEENATNIYLYDRRLERPIPDASIDTDEHRIYALTLGDSNNMTWNKFPKLYLNAYGSSGPTQMVTYDVLSDNIDSTSLYTKGLIFYTDYNPSTNEYIPSAVTCPILYGNNSSNNIIGFRGIKSGDQIIPLLANDGNDTNESDLFKNKFVNFCTLNNHSILGTGDLPVLEAKDLYGHNKITFNKVTDTEDNTFSLIGSYRTEFEKLNTTTSSTEGNLYWSSKIYFRKNDCVYATGYYASSDQRLKDNIEEVQENELEKVPSIKKFNWKSDDRKSYGFIAQELIESGHEELVSEDPDGMYKVDYSAALSLKCAQLEEQNRNLAERVDKLESLIEKLLSNKQ